MNDGEKVVKRRCRWCGETFKVPPDYPKRKGCPKCAPQLFPTTRREGDA